MRFAATWMAPENAMLSSQKERDRQNELSYVVHKEPYPGTNRVCVCMCQRGRGGSETEGHWVFDGVRY